MLIWGWRAVMSVLGSGLFFCPREGGDRPYQHKSARRWFTFFFIPVIPLKELGDFVECSSCKATYYPSVLQARTASQMEDVTTTAIRHVAVAMLRADGQVEESERRAAQSIVQCFASRPYGIEDLERDLAELRVDDLHDHLAELGSILNERGKESVLSAAVFLAGADGHVRAAELDVAHRMGEALSMSRAHVTGTMHHALAQIGGH